MRILLFISAALLLVGPTDAWADSNPNYRPSVTTLEEITPAIVDEYKERGRTEWSGAFADLPPLVLDTDLNNYLNDEIQKGMSLRDAAAGLGQKFSLKPDTAKRLAFALIVTFPTFRLEDYPPPSIQAAKQAYLQAIREHPEMDFLYYSAAELFDADHRCDDPAILDPLLRRGVDFLLKVYKWTICGGVLTGASKIAPEDPRVVKALGDYTEYAQSSKLAMQRLTLVLMDKQGVSKSDPDYLDTEASYLSQLFDAGLDPYGIKALQDLDPKMQDILLSEEKTGHRSYPVLMDKYFAALEDVGDIATAKSVLEKYDRYGEPKAQRADCKDPCRDAHRDILEGADAFDLLLDYNHVGSVHGFVDARLLARKLKKDGYPEAAAYMYPRPVNSARMEEEYQENEKLLRYMPPQYLEFKHEFDVEIAKHEEAMKKEAADYSVLPSPAATALDHKLAQLLAKPKLKVFTEHKNDGSIAKGSDASKPVAEQDAKGIHFPEDMGVVRLEQRGEQLVALCLSHDLDPVGEVSGGGYWVLLSDNDGASWERLYTGLRQYYPYAALDKSALPLLVGGTVQIDVEVQELDERSITFPPVGLGIKRHETGLHITAPLSALRQDSDHDGLTDLVEERIVTDPNDPDTNGNGLKDGDDPLPQISSQGDAPYADMMAIVLSKVFGYDRAAIVTGVGGDRGVDAALKNIAERKPPPLSTTIFVQADPALFNGLSPPARIIVLDDASLKLYDQKFGKTYPVNLEHIWRSHDGKRVIVEWSASWTGGTLYLNRTDGTWSSVELSRWVT